MPPRLYGLAFEASKISHYAGELDLDTGAALVAMARAISKSPRWAQMPDAALVVRPTPRPALAVVGSFSDADAAWLTAQLDDTRTRCRLLRYVSYTQAETDCERLAEQLVDQLGSDMRRFHFTGIPRGGLLVLGMLAYTLGLDQDQLGPHPPGVPLVVVDDCTLSGNRFRRFLRDCESDEVIFAHLYSPAELRPVIEERERQVVSCVAARDVHDHGAEILGREYRSWQEHWLSQLEGVSGPRYWIGLTDHVCFPWSEPLPYVWNRCSRQAEKGWPIVPPELCLKYRAVSGLSSHAIQVQPADKGPLKPAHHVLYGEFEGQIVVGNLTTGESVGVAGVAADIWLGVVHHGNTEDVVIALREKYGVDEEDLRGDVQSFLSELTHRGFLEGGDG